MTKSSNPSTSTESPESSTSTESPESSTSTESPESSTSTESPESSTSTESPESSTSTESPESDNLVRRLRQEAATNRVKAREAGELADTRAAALFDALVKLDGRLADPSDLPFSEDYLTDPAALESAISDLLERKPGLAARQYRGDIGAGTNGNRRVSLIELMRGD